MLLTEESARQVDRQEAQFDRALERLSGDLEKALFGDDGDYRVAQLRASVLGERAHPVRSISGFSQAVSREAIQSNPSLAAAERAVRRLQ